MIKTAEEKWKAKTSLAALLNVVAIYYIVTGIAADMIYVFAPWLYDMILYVLGIFALLFVILSFLYAIKERDWPILMLFILLFSLIGLGIFGVIGP